MCELTSELSDNPLHLLDPIIPFFKKNDKDFRDNGAYRIIVHCYLGGLRAPRFVCPDDRKNVKGILSDFLWSWEKLYYTGQLVFHLKHGEFTDLFDSFPGGGSLNECKEGVRYRVVPFKKRLGDAEFLYRVEEVEDIKFVK